MEPSRQGTSRHKEDRDRSGERKKKKHHRDERNERSTSRSRNKKKHSSERGDKSKKHKSERDRSAKRTDHRDKTPERPLERPSERPQEPEPRRREYDRVLDEKDPYYEERREIEKIRKYDVEKAEHMEIELQKRLILDQKEKEFELAKEKFKESQKELQQVKREDHTILVYCLPLKAKEKDIWNFFSKASVGKIRDIRIIKDGRSGKSKGVAYVEFYTSESVEKALTLTERPFELKGRQFMGLRIQHSQAEKNRTGMAAKQMRVIKPVNPLEEAQETMRRQMKVFVGGLTGKLQEIQQSELKELFDPFGEIDYVDIHRDPQTGKCKGYAFIQYSSTECAKNAVRAMNGLPVGGQKISVQTVSVAMRGDVSAGDDYIHSSGTMSRLIENLSNKAPTHSNLSRPPISTVSTPYLLMTNLFKMEGTTPAFFQDLKKEVGKQAEQFGIVEKLFVEKNNQGNVWLKFSDTQSAIKAQEKLNGKFFDGSKIFCYFVNENTYQLRVGN